MERLERFYGIDQLLKENRGGKATSFAALRQALGVLRATLKRDLKYLRERFHAPVEYRREANGYRFASVKAAKTGPRQELPGPWFDASGLHVLLTMLQLLGSLRPGLLEPQVAPLVERLRGILGQGDRSWQEVEKRIRILQAGRRGPRRERVISRPL